jgi:hypothetical protein
MLQQATLGEVDFITGDYLAGILIAAPRVHVYKVSANID